jgi:hypothetical protein
VSCCVLANSVLSSVSKRAGCGQQSCDKSVARLKAKVVNGSKNRWFNMRVKTNHIILFLACDSFNEF